MKAFIYTRVPTAEQGKSGLGLESQLNTVTEFCNAEAIKVMGHYQDKEREPISARTKTALAVLKGKGVKLGNPTNLDEARLKSNATNREKATEFADNVLAAVFQLRAPARHSGQAQHNGGGVKTRRGGKWYASTVTNILKQA